MPMLSRTALPLAVLAMASLATGSASADETDFVKAALAHGGFKAFVGLVSRAGLADTLGTNPVTVFMPTDAAFARLTAAQRASIAELPPEGVKDFIGRFVFPGTAMASNDVDKTLTSANGTTFDVTWYRGRLSLRDTRGPATSRLAFVVQGDIPAGAGMIDAVDAVLMPARTGGMAVPVASAPGHVAEPTTPAATARSAAAPSTKPAPVSEPASSPAAAATTPAPPPPAASPAPAAPAAEAVRPAPIAVVPPPAPVPQRPDAVLPSNPPASRPAPIATVAAATLRGWPIKVSGNGQTGKIGGVIVGLPTGQLTGVEAHFGGFLGFGGRNVYVPWSDVSVDVKGHVLRAHMSAAEFASAPARAPKP